MAFWENLSGKKKSLLLIVIGVIGIAMIVFGSTQEKENKNLTEISEKNNETLEDITQIETKIGRSAPSSVRIVTYSLELKFSFISSLEIYKNSLPEATLTMTRT